MSLRLAIEHRTEYAYSAPVRASHNEVRMTPAETPTQRCGAASLEILPAPSHRSGHRDYFGTIVECFEVSAPHERLTVVGRAEVVTSAQPSVEHESAATPDDGTEEYVFGSPMVSWDESVASLAGSLRGDDAVTTIRSVMDWMRDALTYEQGATVVGTPVAEIISNGRGVCQDYAHTCCALLRELGIPARYVSGYFAPRALQPGEQVVAQSHAWVEAFVPGAGWWAVDPTNDLPAGDHHVKVGHGRDYSDVVPIAGVHRGRTEQTLDVTVTIRRLP